MTLDEEIARGRRARELLDDELMKELFVEVQKDEIAKWVATRPDDSAGRDNIWRFVHAIERIKDWLCHVRIAGEMAERHQEAIRVANLNDREKWERVDRMGPIPGAPL